MQKHNSNSQLQVDGKMTEKGADRAGLIQSLALLCFAIASIILAVSAVVWALK